MMKQEEQINRYLEHGMSSAEEQNFLISLAASDDMRMAFRSHLELMKAVRRDKDDLRSVAQVRNRTLAALGLSATAASAFIEQELVRSNKEHAAPLQHAEVVSGPGPLLTRIGRFIGMQKLAIGTGLALGFLAATGVFTSGLVGSSHEALKSPSAAVSQPVSEPKAPAESPATSATVSNETVEHTNALHNRGRAHHSAPASVGTQTVAAPTTPANLNRTSEIPEVNKVGQGQVSANKAKINKPNDSNQAH